MSGIRNVEHYKVIRDAEGEPTGIEPCSHFTWGVQLGHDNLRLWHTVTEDGQASISTICLGFDVNFGDFGKVALFESAVDCEPVNRYATFEEAKAGHEELVKNWKTAILPG